MILQGVDLEDADDFCSQNVWIVPYEDFSGRSVYDIRHAKRDPTVAFQVLHIF